MCTTGSLSEHLSPIKKEYSYRKRIEILNSEERKIFFFLVHLYIFMIVFY